MITKFFDETKLLLKKAWKTHLIFSIFLMKYTFSHQNFSTFTPDCFTKTNDM